VNKEAMVVNSAVNSLQKTYLTLEGVRVESVSKLLKTLQFFFAAP
jgi:hypothetical protein